MMTLAAFQVIGAIPLSSIGGTPPEPPVAGTKITDDAGAVIIDDEGAAIITGD